MQVGSLVECIKGFEDSPWVILSNLLDIKIKPPVVGENYIVEEIKRCSCNRHNNLRLDSIDGYWNETHFREIQPPINLENILEHEYKESLEEVYQ